MFKLRSSYFFIYVSGTHFRIIQNASIEVNGCIEISGKIEVEIGEEEPSTPFLVFNASCPIDLSPVEIQSTDNLGCEKSAHLDVQDLGDERLGVYVRFVDECEGENKGAIIGGAIAGFLLLVFIVILFLLVFIKGLRKKVWPHHMRTDAPKKIAINGDE